MHAAVAVQRQHELMLFAEPWIGGGEYAHVSAASFTPGYGQACRDGVHLRRHRGDLPTAVMT